MPMQVNITMGTGFIAEHLLFEGNAYSIGRSNQADVLINHPQVSRAHAMLSANDDDMWSFQDTSSAGCFHQGRRITSLSISDEKIVRLGPVSCQFRYLDHHQLTAIDNKQTWRKQQLEQMSKQFSQCSSNQTLLDSARHCLLQTLGCERAALILLDQEKDLQQCLGYQPWMRDHNFSGSRTIIKRCIAQQKALAIGNILNEPELAGQHSVMRNNIQAALCVPIKLDNHLSGVLYADNTQKRQSFTQTDVQFVESFANILSLRLLFQSIEHNISLACNY
ncbi:MAG: hypothetical protein ACI88A_001910 [Paraglaciecola sp.]